MSKLDVKQVVICEDVRREFNGKEILIGVYGSDIAVATFPVQLALAFWLQFVAKESHPSPISLEFRLIGENDTQFAAFTVQALISKAGNGSFGLPPVVFSLQIPSELTLQMKQEGGDWETISKFGVEKGIVPMPFGLPPNLPR